MRNAIHLNIVYFFTIINASIILRPGPMIYHPRSYIASDPPLSRLIASTHPKRDINVDTSSIEIFEIVPIFISLFAVRQMNDFVLIVFIFAVMSPRDSYRGTILAPLARRIGKFAIPLWISRIIPEWVLSLSLDSQYMLFWTRIGEPSRKNPNIPLIPVSGKYRENANPSFATIRTVFVVSAIPV
jgi:hypothetical protein